MTMGENYKRGDIPGSTVTAGTWFHFALTWPGPGNQFKTFINGVYQTTSVSGECHELHIHICRGKGWLVYSLVSS